MWMQIIDYLMDFLFLYKYFDVINTWISALLLSAVYLFMFTIIPWAPFTNMD